MRKFAFASTFALAFSMFAGEIGGGPVPVVVELFTSEACSSCPPADALLTDLAWHQPIDHVQVIPLSEHVDYWNSTGWVDPFSSPLFRMRQEQYAGVFRQKDIYTPQMIVDGRAEFVGSDSVVARQQIAAAARAPHALVSIGPVGNGSESAPKLRLRVSGIPAMARREPLEIVLSVTESGLRSSVRGGENAGRTLTHTAVVRSMTLLAELDPRKDQGYNAEIQVPLLSAWNRKTLRAVLLVQEKTSRRIIGAATCPL
jgi:hypothetical protein